MTYENNEFKVTVEDSKVMVVKKAFNDLYVCRIDENGKLRASTSLALKMGMKARNVFGF